MAANDFNEISFTARDGLRLYGRHYPAARSNPAAPGTRRPVLCLAGLTRNSRDFNAIAAALSRHPQPRARSTRSICGAAACLNTMRDWRNYSVPIEMQDVIDFMTMTGLHDAGIIGTSRGGLITHVLAAAQPTRIGAVVLNDIGPVIDIEGLVRIAGYVGRMPVPKSWGDAARADPRSHRSAISLA